MQKNVSPESFARRQMLARAVPILVVMGLLMIGWLAIDHGQSRSLGDVLVSVGGYLFFVLTTGGIALGYLGWWFSLNSKGILSTPRKPWEIGLQPGVVTVTSATSTTRIPLASVRALTIIWDDNFDKLHGLEDKCLAIDLHSGRRILVPGSSEAFESTVEALKVHMAVETKFVE